MSRLFQVEAKDLINLRKFYKKAPKQFQRVSANVLTSFAFGTRTESLGAINDKMTVRNKRFVDGSVRVVKARSGPISSQESEMGSINRARFSGWAEQELGTPTKRTRVATALARGNNPEKQIKPSLRLKPSNQFISPKEYKGRSEQHRTNIMIWDLMRTNSKKPFRIRKHRKFKPGLYKFVRKKIVAVQVFAKASKLQPKRIRWMTTGINTYFKKNPPRRVWGDSIRHILKFKF